MKERITAAWKWCRKYHVVRILAIFAVLLFLVYVKLPEKQVLSCLTPDVAVSEKTTGSIGAGQRARQEIRFQENVTAKDVRIRFAITGTEDKNSFLTVKLLEKQTKKVLARQKVSLTSMKQDKATVVHFKKGVALRENTGYLVIVTAPKRNDGADTPGIYYATPNDYLKNCYVAGQKIAGAVLALQVHYEVDDSLNKQGFYLAGLLLLLLLIIPRSFEKRLGKVAGVGWALFFCNPTIVFSLTKCLYGMQDRAYQEAFVLNCALLFLLQCVLFGVIGNRYITLLLLDGTALLLALASIQVILFRGAPVTPSDLMFVKTALDVSDSYQLTFSHEQLRYLSFFLVYLFFVAVLGQYKIDRESWKRRYVRAAKVVLRFSIFLVGVIGIRYLYVSDVIASSGISYSVWYRKQNCEQNGVYLDFFMNLHYLNMERPKEYSRQQVEEILKPYRTEEKEEKTKQQRPNIIVIMNESLADYNLVSKDGNAYVSQDYLPYIHSLNDHIVKGKCYVSIYGSLTADSEFECLTGNSMAFLPLGSVPYQQYMKKETLGLPRYIKSLGYRTMAIHPCKGSNWNRTAAYRSLGFDTFLTQDDFVNAENIRHITDDATYKKIEEQMEQKKDDERLFVMAVTMQNHGAYTTGYPFETQIVADDGSYPKANEYLSSAYLSDQAYEHLLSYFKDYKEPTLILMFGDHQPAVEEEYVSQVIRGDKTMQYDQAQMQERYCTPFLLWANYDIGTRTDVVTSTNYLYSTVLQYAGLPQDTYSQYLSALQTKLPAINAYGYRTTDGVWHGLFDEGEHLTQIKDYQMVEYGHFGERSLRLQKEMFGK